MEVVVVPHKQIKTPKRCANSRPNSYVSSENFAPRNINGGVSFYHPPYLSSPPLSSTHRHQQPPLLPLPIHLQSSSPSKPAPKVLKSRDQSLTPKKSKAPGRNRDLNLHLTSSPTPASDRPIKGSTTHVDLSSVLPPLPSSLLVLDNDFSYVDMKEFEKFPGSVFTLSPHPSSLPLPKFSIRSKVKLIVESAGIDAGATDNLRRLLRLR